MAEITNDLIYEVLKQVQTAQADVRLEMREEVSHINRRLGSLAENFNHMRHDIHAIREDLQKLRSDVEIVAIAVDRHSDRPASLEERVPPLHS